jgi:hypothetical protein
MSVSVHRSQLTPDYHEQLARLLTAAGERLSRLMGHLPVLPPGRPASKPKNAR